MPTDERSRLRDLTQRERATFTERHPRRPPRTPAVIIFSAGCR